MTWRRTLDANLCGRVRDQLLEMPAERAEMLREIRIRRGQKICWVFSDGYRQTGGAVTAQEMDALLSALCGHARYAYEEQMAKGYIPLGHGHRAGVCGQVVYENGRIARMSDITSVCIRIARRIVDAGRPIRPLLFVQGRPSRVLLIGPPGSGKTTVLRDTAEYLARECALHVAVADEREEIMTAECGVGCDVLRGADKADAVELLLRTMSPQVIVCDEIGKEQDAEAIMNTVTAGVGVLASAHASTFSEAMNRPVLKELMGNHVFDWYVLLAPFSRCVGVMDAKGKELNEQWEAWMQR